jgi:acid phosphatase (class A)
VTGVQTCALPIYFNYSKYKANPFPKNASMQTYSDLNFLHDLPEDKEFVKKHDDIEKVFKEVCQDYNVEYPEKLVKELLESSAGIILDIKYHYNRPRPKQLAKEYEMNIGGIELESMSSPSYPSGHSTQGFLIGKILQTKLPINTDAFLQASQRISYSRNIARAHFPSDSKMGEELGSAMYTYLKEKL